MTAAPRPALCCFLLCLAILAAPLRSQAGDAGLTVECRKEIMVVLVHYMAVGLGNLLKDIPDPKHQTQAIRRFMEDNLFYEDKSGYMFVYDFDGENIAHGDKTMLGQNLALYEDGKGLTVHKSFLDAVRRGGGFVRYRFHKPGKRGSMDKLSYAEQIPGTNYYVGSGVYLY